MWTKTLIGMGDPELNRPSKPKPEPDTGREEAETAPEREENRPRKEHYA